MGKGQKAGFASKKVGIFILLLQVIFLILLGIFARYSSAGDVSEDTAVSETEFPNSDPVFQQQPDFEGIPVYHLTVSSSLNTLRPVQIYGMLQDVHIMVFIGFGFLMTFLRRYGYSAVGFNLLLAALTIQWFIIDQGFISMYYSGKSTFSVDIESLISGDFAAAAILISFGVVLGKTSPFQLVVMALIEVLFYTVNLHICENVLEATDAGGAMFIHAFGAYFGLAVSMAMKQKWYGEHPFADSNYHSDLFAMIGSLFLWICWPSFNGALLSPGEEQHRAAINTYFSLSACVLVTFAFSMVLSRRAKFDMFHVQNATLAGGVAIGTMANFVIQPWCAGLIGLLAGMLSVIGYSFITPLLTKKLGLHDTCGVHNLHGMPGVLAGISGIIVSAVAGPEIYGQNGLTKVFHGRGPYSAEQSTRTTEYQSGMQAAALGITLGMAIVGGLITGLLLRFLRCLDPVPVSMAFSDMPYWEIPEDDIVADEADIEGKVTIITAEDKFVADD